MLNLINIRTVTNIIKGIVSIQILQPTFWFRNPGAASFTSIEILSCLGFFSLVFLVGIVTLFINRWKIRNYPPKNQIFQPAGWGLFGIGLSGIFFTLIRSQGVSFLGARFFLLLFAVASFAWAGYFLRRYFKELPAEIVSYEAKELKKKYLKK